MDTPANELSFRALRDRDEVKDLLAVRQASAAHDRLDPLSTCEHVADFDELTRLTDDERLIVVTAHDQIVGDICLSQWRESDGTNVYLHNLHLDPRARSPQRWQAMLDYAEQCLRQQAGGAVDQAVFASNASATETDQAKFLQDNGYQVVWTMIEMELTNFDVAPPVLVPGDIVVGAPRPDEYRAIWQMNEEVYAGTWGYIAPDHDESDFVASHLAQPELCLVARQREKIVGFILCQQKDDVAVIGEFSVAKDMQGRGIGRILLTRVIGLLGQRGAHRIRLHTDADNQARARGLYERIGFQPIKLYYRFRKPMSRNV